MTDQERQDAIARLTRLERDTLATRLAKAQDRIEALEDLVAKSYNTLVLARGFLRGHVTDKQSVLAALNNRLHAIERAANAEGTGDA